MEVVFVYGLAVAFFVLLIPVIYLFMKAPTPYVEQTEEEGDKASKKSAASAKSVSPSQKVAYGVLAALFTFMCVLTVLVHREDG